jgi:hypothetical protein
MIDERGDSGMTIRIHIEELLLDGLPVLGHEGPAVRKAVEKELSRLFAEGGLSRELAGGGAFPDVPNGNMKITGTGPSKIGKEIARAVYGGIGR